MELLGSRAEDRADSNVIRSIQDRLAGLVNRVCRDAYQLVAADDSPGLVSGQVPDSDLYLERLDTRGITSRQDDEKTDMIHKIMRDYRDAAADIIKEKYARDLAEMVDRKRRSLVTEER